MVVGNTPETTNPVSRPVRGQRRAVHLHAWRRGSRGSSAAAAMPGESQFEWTYHFFWGLEDIIATFTAMWDQIETNSRSAACSPTTATATPGATPTRAARPDGGGRYTIVDPGRYENGNQDFTAQITAFKEADCEIVTGVVIPPDFPTFWSQAKQQGFVPKAATVGKALLFPESVAAIGADGVGLSSEVWWSPNHPYSSSLVGLNAAEFAAAYTEATGNQWTQPIGFAHALFEVAIAALVAAGSTEKVAVRDAIPTLGVDTIVGTRRLGAADNPVPQRGQDQARRRPVAPGGHADRLRPR